MKCELIPVTRENLDVLARLAADPYFHILRSVRYLERLLFNDVIEEYREEPVRGYMLRTERGEYVGMQCFYPVYIYLRQERKVAFSGAVLGMKRRYAAWLGDLFDAACEKEGETLRFGNAISNTKSMKTSECCLKAIAGPSDGECARRCVMLTLLPIAILRRVRVSSRWVLDPLWILTHPIRIIGALMKCIFRPKKRFPCKVLSGFSDERFLDLWKRILDANDGVISSRDPAILRHYFDESIAAGTVILIAAENLDGTLQGYILLRKYPLYETRHVFSYKICDVCSVGNDVECMRELVKEGVIYAERHGGGYVEYIGANPHLDKWLDPILKYRRQFDHPTFTYSCPDSESALKQALETRTGWFFGPYDGERCLGCGQYVDI